MAPHRSEAIDHAMRVIAGQELRYADEWGSDAHSLQNSGLYDAITSFVDPQDGQTIVDIGTGNANQLISLVLRNPRPTYIGTERSRPNVIATYESIQRAGLKNVFTMVATSQLTKTADGKAFWKFDASFVRDRLEQIREHLKQKVLLIDDNILYPEILPIVLGDQKIDAGILSMPGGSSSRTIEWPFRPDEVRTQADLRRIATDVTNRTRTAFFRLMSEYVRPEGRIVVAERILLTPESSVRGATRALIGEHMGDLTKYWQPISGTFLDIELHNTTVELHGLHADGQHVSMKEIQGTDQKAGVVIIRIDRNDVPFNEPPVPRPTAAV